MYAYQAQHSLSNPGVSIGHLPHSLLLQIDFCPVFAFCHSSCQECSLTKKYKCWIYRDLILTLPIILSLYLCGGFSGGSVVKNPPASAGDTGSIPGLGDPLEKKMATPSSVLAWEIPWTEEAGRPQSIGSPVSDMTEWVNNNKVLWKRLILERRTRGLERNKTSNCWCFAPGGPDG